jgi:hypothetical protein
VTTREQNERRFKHWEALPDGGRRYWTERRGAVSGYQRMIKVVDADEETVRVVQEIYNDEGELIELHQKYPVDAGHEKLVDEE